MILPPSHAPTCSTPSSGLQLLCAEPESFPGGLGATSTLPFASQPANLLSFVLGPHVQGPGLLLCRPGWSPPPTQEPQGHVGSLTWAIRGLPAPLFLPVVSFLQAASPVQAGSCSSGSEPGQGSPVDTTTALSSRESTQLGDGY